MSSLNNRLTINSILIIVTMLISNSALADAKTQSGLLIRVVLPVSDGLLVGFKQAPSDCPSSFRATHAFLSKSVIGYDDYAINLSLARAQNNPIKITYNTAGDCSSHATTLKITKIQF